MSSEVGVCGGLGSDCGPGFDRGLIVAEMVHVLVQAAAPGTAAGESTVAATLVETTAAAAEEAVATETTATAGGV